MHGVSRSKAVCRRTLYLTELWYDMNSILFLDRSFPVMEIPNEGSRIS